MVTCSLWYNCKLMETIRISHISCFFSPPRSMVDWMSLHPLNLGKANWFALETLRAVVQFTTFSFFFLSCWPWTGIIMEFLSAYILEWLWWTNKWEMNLCWVKWLRFWSSLLMQHNKVLVIWYIVLTPRPK